MQLPDLSALTLGTGAIMKNRVGQFLTPDEVYTEKREGRSFFNDMQRLILAGVVTITQRGYDVFELKFNLDAIWQRRVVAPDDVWERGRFLSLFTQCLQQPPFFMRYNGATKTWSTKASEASKGWFVEWMRTLDNERKRRSDEDARAAAAQEYRLRKAREEDEARQREFEAQRAIVQREIKEREAAEHRRRAAAEEQRTFDDAVRATAQRLRDRVLKEGFGVVNNDENVPEQYMGRDFRRLVDEALRTAVQERFREILRRLHGRVNGVVNVNTIPLEYPQMQPAIEAVFALIARLTDVLLERVRQLAGEGADEAAMRARCLTHYHTLSATLPFPEDVGIHLRVDVKIWPSDVRKLVDGPGGRTLREVVNWNVQAVEPQFHTAVKRYLQRNGYASLQVRSPNSLFGMMNALFETLSAAERGQASQWTFHDADADDYNFRQGRARAPRSSAAADDSSMDDSEEEDGASSSSDSFIDDAEEEDGAWSSSDEASATSGEETE